MTQKPPQRRGLGRGLGSLIPTGPRPEHHEGGSVLSEVPVARESSGDGSVAGEAVAGGVSDGAAVPAGPGSADWIGVPLPGDNVPGTTSDGAADESGTAGSQDGNGAGATATRDRADGGAERPQEQSAGQSESAEGHPAAATDGSSPESGRHAADGESAVTRDEDGEQRARENGQPDGAATHDAVAVHDGVAVAGTATDVDPGTELRPVDGAYFAELPVEDIRPNPRQPREVFDEEAMAELVHSVREVGLLQPIVVRDTGDGQFELIMGERRWRATQQAGLPVIPSIVRQTGDDDLLRDALLENLHRSQLNALEEAAAYQQLLEDFGCTHDQLATRIGRSRPQISNTIRLLKLSPAVQRRVAAGVLSAGHARALLAVEDAEVQDRLAGRVVAEGISVRALEEIVAVGDLGKPRPPARRSRPTAPGVEDLAVRLSDRLETRVKVDLGKRKGRITVEFASLPDLERIIGLIDPGHPNRTRQESSE